MSTSDKKTFRVDIEVTRTELHTALVQATTQEEAEKMIANDIHPSVKWTITGIQETPQDLEEVDGLDGYDGDTDLAEVHVFPGNNSVN